MTDLTAQKVRQLPCFHREIVPDSYLDELGHLTFNRYFDIFSKGWWPFNRAIGLDADYAARERGGLFALEHYVRFLAEVHATQEVGIYTHIVGYGRKRVHYISFMVNETTDRVAALAEGVSAYTNLDSRRTAPLPAAIGAAIASVMQKQQLSWEPPLCGVIEIKR